MTGADAARGMNKRIYRLRAMLGAAAVLIVSACGQKGPLYLPDSGGEVVTRPAGQRQPPETAPQPSPQTPTESQRRTDDEKKSQTPR